MSAPNFSYQHRCVVVTDEDYECGNTPLLGEWNDGDRSYPSTELHLSEKAHLKLVKAVITGGYYSGACIDYIDTGETVEGILGSAYYFTTHNRAELIDTVQYYFPAMSKRAINKCFKGCNKSSDDYENQIWKAFDKLTEAIVAYESRIANSIVDKVKKSLGLNEYVRTAIFSNGEAIYTNIEALRARVTKS